MRNWINDSKHNFYLVAEKVRTTWYHFYKTDTHTHTLTLTPRYIYIYHVVWKRQQRCKYCTQSTEHLTTPQYNTSHRTTQHHTRIHTQTHTHTHTQIAPIWSYRESAKNHYTTRRSKEWLYYLIINKRILLLNISLRAGLQNINNCQPLHQTSYIRHHNTPLPQVI